MSLDAFRTHPIVALGEGQHWNMQGHAYRLSLIRDSRVAKVVDDIVVEFGDARHQSVIDRYVAGRDVPYDEPKRVWEDTTTANIVFDMPIYEEIFRTPEGHDARCRALRHRLRSDRAWGQYEIKSLKAVCGRP